MDEVLSAFQDLQRRDVDGKDGGPAANVFVLEHQLRSVIGESDRRTDLVLRRCRRRRGGSVSIAATSTDGWSDP